MEDLVIAKALIRRLLRKPNIGAAHTDADWVTRIRGDLRGQAKRVLKDLIKQGLILAKKTPYGSGLHVSLNPRMLNEINKILQQQ